MNRSLRGFEALIDYLKTEGAFEPKDSDTRQLLEIELRYFKIKCFIKTEPVYS